MKPVNISIKEPCNEDWQKMTPKEQGRHCEACNKCVVDFTNFTDKEIFNYLTKSSSQQTCGRFTTAQLGRDINPSAKDKSGFPIYRLAASLVVGGLSVFSTKLMAQFPQVQEELSQKEDESRVKQIVISGTVRHIGTGVAVENALVNIGKDSIYTDSLGNYQLEYNGLDTSLPVLVEAEGFIKKETKISLSHLPERHSSILTSDFGLEKTSNEHLFIIEYTMGDICIPEFEDSQTLNTLVYGFVTGTVSSPPSISDSQNRIGKKNSLIGLKKRVGASIEKMRTRFSTKFLRRFGNTPFKVKKNSIKKGNTNQAEEKREEPINGDNMPLKPKMEAVFFEDKLRTKN